MNLIFLTLGRITGIGGRGIYTDLMRKFRDEGHNVWIVCPAERRYHTPTSIKEQDGVTILSVKTFNIQKTNLVEKGIGTIMLESQFKNAIRKYLKDVRFDLILYSTPPITLTSVVEYLKKRNTEAISYLLLKDIFPQNAVDLGMFSKRSLIYKVFRRKEQRLYRLSDYIGCMSPANVRYLLQQDPEIDSGKVEVNPNSLEAVENVRNAGEREEIRKKYDLPLDKPVFVYGGNLGKPQGIAFLIECLQNNRNRDDCYFLIVGSGTEYPRLKSWFDREEPKSARLLSALPASDYNILVRSCDVGMIFLDHRFTIPNFPSRLLSYLENRMPVIAFTDENTDVGDIISKNGFGISGLHGHLEDFNNAVDEMIGSSNNLVAMGEKGYQFFLKNYTVDVSYKRIMSHV